MTFIYYSEVKDGICLLYGHDCDNLLTLDRGFGEVGEVCGLQEDVRDFLLTYKYNLIGVYHES